MASRAAHALLILALSSPASAKFRVTRVLDWQSGLPVSFVGGVEQDPEGFLWLGTSAGGFRYDGSEMVQKFPLGRGMVPGSARAGALLAFRPREDGTWELENFDGTPLPGPDGGPVRTFNAYMSPDGALWAMFGVLFVKRALAKALRMARFSLKAGRRGLARAIALGRRRSER